MDLSEELIKDGQQLFEEKPFFVKGVVDVAGLPVGTMPEFAFAGRSNVGKSSLINAVTGVPKLARASSTPGRTQELNFFEQKNKFYIVDLPGYGFANAPEAKVQVWTRLIHDYLRGRQTLRRVFLLIDIRHGIKPVDENIMKMLDKAAVSYQIILTKGDKVSEKEADKMLKTVMEIGKKHVACYPEMIVTSAEKNKNVDRLRAEFVKVLRGI